MNTEPTLIVAAVGAVLNLAVGFGLHWTPEQITLINAAIIAVMALVIRQHVTPAP